MAFESLTSVNVFWKQKGVRYILANHANPMSQNLSVSLQDSFPEPTGKPCSMCRPPLPDAAALNVSKRQNCTNSSTWTPLPRDKFPDFWRERLEKTRPGLAAWTYMGLAADLGEEPRNEIEKQSRQLRKNFMQGLIRELAEPAGTHTFWPCALYGKNGLETDPEAFWSGLHWLGCRILFIFGQAAGAACMLPEPIPNVYRACLVCVFDDLEKLATAPAGKFRAATVMKSAFGMIRTFQQR